MNAQPLPDSYGLHTAADLEYWRDRSAIDRICADIDKLTTPLDEILGQTVHRVRTEWLRQQPESPQKLPGWDDLNDRAKEFDRLIGRALFDAGYRTGLDDGRRRKAESS